MPYLDNLHQQCFVHLGEVGHTQGKTIKPLFQLKMLIGQWTWWLKNVILFDAIRDSGVRTDDQVRYDNLYNIMHDHFQPLMNILTSEDHSPQLSMIGSMLIHGHETSWQRKKHLGIRKKCSDNRRNYWAHLDMDCSAYHFSLKSAFKI